MTTDKVKFPVIELVDVPNFPRITRDGYYPVVITQAQWKYSISRRLYLWVKFEVKDGPGKGAWLQRRFYRTDRSIKSLSYLCGAVGITGKLQDPSPLIGKELIVRVNLGQNHKQGTRIPEPNLFVELNNYGGERHDHD